MLFVGAIALQCSSQSLVVVRIDLPPPLIVPHFSPSPLSFYLHKDEDERRSPPSSTGIPLPAAQVREHQRQRGSRDRAEEGAGCVGERTGYSWEALGEHEEGPGPCWG